jgi:hypothetical protein
MHALDDVLAGLAHDGSERRGDSGKDELKNIIDVDKALEKFEKTAKGKLSRFITKLYYLSSS